MANLKHKLRFLNNRSNLVFTMALAVILFASVGAYFLLSSRASPTIAADFNSDGTVNIFDLSILATNWNRAGATNAMGDANSDATVNIFDLSILASQWGQTDTPSPTPTVSITPTPTATPSPTSINTTPPASPTKLIFIHHSTGEAWLYDNHGGLAIALRNNNYFVSDTNYGWGPDSIGSNTDLGHWWTWFRGPSSANYMSALYAESDRHSNGYSRLATDPGGPNQIVMFKSCFPNSVLRDDGLPIPLIANNPLKNVPWGGGLGWETYTLSNVKGIYNDLLNYFRAHPEKLFIAIVAPPVANEDTNDGRRLANWLVNNWLQDSNYSVGNVFVFDFYNVLTSKTGSGLNDANLDTGNHHRVWNNVIQHKTDQGTNRLAYPSAGGDSHPNAAGGQKATSEFIPLLNAAYNSWKNNR